MAQKARETSAAGQKAVIYIRVSTKEQSLEGYSLDHQEAACREYAGKQGLEVAGICLDVISGGKTSRPGLDSATKAAAETGACLIVWALDRLGRNMAHLAQIRESGLVVHVVSKGGPLSTTEWGIFATLAQDERETISRRTRAGMAQKAKSEPSWKPGGVRVKGAGAGAGEGIENYRLGAKASAKSRREKATMATIEPANVIRYLFARGENLSQIARALEGMKIPTPGGKGKWSAQQVKRIMSLHGIGQGQDGARK